MKASRRHNARVAALMALALLAAFAPHVAILTYKLADARPPAALIFICPLHHGSVSSPGQSSR